MYFTCSLKFLVDYRYMSGNMQLNGAHKLILFKLVVFLEWYIPTQVVSESDNETIIELLMTAAEDEFGNLFGKVIIWTVV